MRRTGPIAKVGCALASLVALVCLGPARALAASDQGCPSAGGENVELAGVESRLELRLTDGRLLRLAGLDPAASTPSTPDREDQARDALSQLLAGRPLAITKLSSAPDRWGRLAVLAFTDGDQPGGVAAAAISRGLGRYLSEPAAHACRGILTAAEDASRAQKLGLWADPYYAVLTASDLAGFAERAGTLVVAEGRVASVKSGPYRSQLIFAGERNGSRGGQLLSATLLPRTIKILEAHGVHVTSLTGQLLRIRGLLDLRFGPEIEVSSADDLDVVGSVTAPALAAGSK